MLTQAFSIALPISLNNVNLDLCKKKNGEYIYLPSRIFHGFKFIIIIVFVNIRFYHIFFYYKEIVYLNWRSKYKVFLNYDNWVCFRHRRRGNPASVANQQQRETTPHHKFLLAQLCVAVCHPRTFTYLIVPHYVSTFVKLVITSH